MKLISMKTALLGASCLLCLTIPALAQETAAADDQDWYDKIHTDLRLTLQYIVDENQDLGTASEETEDTFSQQLQMMTGVDFTEDYFGFAHLRALNIEGENGFDDDTGRTIGADQAFLELRELYLQKKNLFGVVPLSLQIGRQRVREPRALWWNSDHDLVRLNYNSTLLNGFLAAGENLSSYRNNTESDFREDDEDRLRFLGEASYQYAYNHFIESRFLYEDDHSGTEAPGTVISINDRDIDDHNLLWAGVRAAGDFGSISNAAKIKYRADLIGVAGEEDFEDSISGPTASTRTVTGTSNRDVMGWALDSGVIVDPFEEGGIAVTLGYAFGSGDEDGTGTDHAFRQTDMQGNSSRIGLERQQQRNYGEVLKPELSNLHILTAGAAYPVTDATEATLTYFNYHLDENATALRSSGINAPLNGSDKDVGQGLDFIVNVNVGEEFKVEVPYVERTDFRFIAGSFFPGDAYEPSNDEAALRLFTELRFRF